MGEDSLLRLQLAIEALEIKVDDLNQSADDLKVKALELQIELEHRNSLFALADLRLSRVEKIVYGAIGIVLTTVFSSLVYLVVTRPGGF